MAAAEPHATDSVVSRLRHQGERSAALDALHGALDGDGVEHALSLAVSPVLCELLAADAAEVSQEQFDCIALLLARLSLEGVSPAEVHVAAFGEGRLAALWGSDSNVVSQALQKSADELTSGDVRSLMCMSVAIGASMSDYRPKSAKTKLPALELAVVWPSTNPLCP